MSIAVMNEIEALKRRVAALEELVRMLAVQAASPPPQSTLRLKEQTCRSA